MTISTHSNHYFFTKQLGDISLDTHNLRVLLMGVDFVFDKDSHSVLSDVIKSTRLNTTGYVLDDLIILNTPDGHVYKCTTAGTSAGSEPTFDTGSGATTVDGGVVWTEDGEYDELPTGNGYTRNTKLLVTDTHTENDIDDRAEIVYHDVVWVASGGSIGPTVGAIIYDDSTVDDTVIGYIDFEVEYTVLAETNFLLGGIEFRDS